MTRWLRAPALHFLVIGGLSFAAYSWGRPGPLGTALVSPAPKTVVISAEQIALLKRQWRAQNGRLPEAGELGAAIEHAVEDEILYREALARGLDRDDEVVRQRLISVMGFVSSEPGQDDEALYREALRLGLDRSDLVVRRHLVQLMRLLARRAEVPRPVSDDDLQALVDREPERWRAPAAVTLTHVFLSQSRRGASTERDARGLLERLRSEHVNAAEAPALGDPFPLGYQVKRASDRDLQKTFGVGFAGALAPVKDGEWSGPIRSSYGEHLVWIHERFPARMPPLDAIRTQLLQQLRDERGEEHARAKLREWRAEYAIQVADVGKSEPPAELPVSPSAADLPLPKQQPFLGD